MKNQHTRKTILITGASSGIGAGLAREFAARGHNLALCARRTERLEQLRSELAGSRVRIACYALDVNQHDQVFAVFEQVAQEFGTLDRVIVNAGVGDGRRIGKGYFEQNRHIAETNFIGALAQAEAAVGIFRRQNAGHLVLIASISARRGLPGHLTTYAASKAAVAHLGEGITADLMQTPIRVSTIFPGYIRTELNQSAGKLPFEVDAASGARLLAHAIAREPRTASVPAWPWTLIGVLMRILPLRLISRMN